VLAAYLAVAPAGNLLPVSRSQASGPNGQPDAVPGELIVKYRQPMAAAAERIVNSAVGSKQVARANDLGVSLVTVTAGASADVAAQRYRSLPQVEYAEPNVIVQADMTPNDPLYSRQQWYYDEIGAPKAWDVETGKPYVIVAVLDTGVDITHPDLQGAIWTNRGEVADNGVDDDSNGCIDDVHGCNFLRASTPPATASCAMVSEPDGTIDDDDGHGTFVAGIIAARGNNRIGVIGMAPDVTIMPVKVLDCQGTGTALAAAEGVVYAAKEGASVINISFGAKPDSPDSATLQQAVNQAHDVYGVTIVAAAGNTALSGDSAVTAPANYPNVIAVSASDHSASGGKALFSNWGPEIDLTAPGVDIVSTVPAKFCAHMGCFGSEPYASSDGTSLSTPLVSGAAALLLSSGRVSTPDQVKALLEDTASRLPDASYPNWDGSGMIQIDKALAGKSYQLGLTALTKN
jgi:subtilisin family serine protease